MSAYQTPNFTVTTGTHTVELLGMSPPCGDSTAFHRRSDDHAGGRFAAGRRFRAAGPGRQCLRHRSQRHALAVLRIGRRGGQRQRLRRELGRDPERPGGNAGRLSSRHRQHQPDRVPRRRHLPALVRWLPSAFNQTYYQEIEVLVDNNILLNSGQPDSIDPASTQYESYESATFTVAAGAHTIEFLGLNPLGGDNTAFIDQVAISHGQRPQPTAASRPRPWTQGNTNSRSPARPGSSRQGPASAAMPAPSPPATPAPPTATRSPSSRATAT